MFGTFFGKREKNLNAQVRIEVALDLELQSRHLRSGDFAFEEEFKALQEWQIRRLLIQYDHLFVRDSTAEAAAFILKEVYSGDIFIAISDEIRKTAHKAWRLASSDIILASADAIEAHVDTQNFDQCIALYTFSHGGIQSSTGSDVYAAALCSGQHVVRRQEQLIKLRQTAENFERYLRKNTVHIGLKMTSKLAQKAGVFNLHQFLSKACTVFKDTVDVLHIFNEITTTELELLSQVLQGKNPFKFMDVAFNAQNKSRQVS